jgi:hypothetical protein
MKRERRRKAAGGKGKEGGELPDPRGRRRVSRASNSSEEKLHWGMELPLQTGRRGRRV